MILLSFTSHCCWSSFLLFHCKQCVIAACQWGRVWTRLQTELFTSFVSTGDTEEFYLEKTNCKLEGHPFSKVCFQSPVLFNPFLLRFKQNMAGSLKLLIVFLSHASSGWHMQKDTNVTTKKWSVLNILVSFYCIGSLCQKNWSILKCEKYILYTWNARNAVSDNLKSLPPPPRDLCSGLWIAWPQMAIICFPNLIVLEYVTCVNLRYTCR